MKNTEEETALLVRRQALVDVARVDEPGATYTGFIVDSTRQYVVIHQLSDSIDLDGYHALSWSVVDHLQEVEAKAEKAYRHVLEERGQSIVRPSLTLDNLMVALMQAETLVSLSERDDAEVCMVGRIKRLGPEPLLQLVSPLGVVSLDERVISLSIVAAIEWGTRYLDAVSIMQRWQDARS